jgi:hypothetical protein
VRSGAGRPHISHPRHRPRSYGLEGSITCCSTVPIEHERLQLSVFYPHAKEFTKKAKGATGVDTLINLTNMAEATAKAAKGGRGVDRPFDDLHNQFHAIDSSICCVDKSVKEQPAYALP